MATRGLALLIVLLVITFTSPPAWNKPISAQNKPKHDQELFLDGAKAIGEQKYEQGRILLRTLIYTYADDSYLKDQAKLLIFFSYAREGGPRNEKEVKLLKEIEELLKEYEPRQKDQ